MPTRAKAARESGTAKSVRKYLDQHAEPEAASALSLLPPETRFGHVLCIPAQGEGKDLLRALETIPDGSEGPVLAILVVNECQSSVGWIRHANQETLLALRKATSTARTGAKNLEWRRAAWGTVLLIDRTASGLPLPEKQGVGVARKISADIALAFWAEGRVASSWIHCSDADVQFPSDYFSRLTDQHRQGGLGAGPAAWVYDFVHVLEPDDHTARAALRYEIFLRYYVLGLRHAGSPYAFHTIGSTLAISALAYAQARGFPRRQAAEDFHLLAKLAKLGPIQPLRGEPIRLSGRVSTRVPFGTGAGIAKELERIAADEFYPAYDPRIFEWLRVWRLTLEAAADNANQDSSVPELLMKYSEGTDGLEGPALLAVLDELGAISAAEVGRPRGLRHLHEHFDALRTLRFVHHLRDRRFPSIPLASAIRQARFLPDLGTDEPDLTALRSALARVEAQDTSR